MWIENMDLEYRERPIPNFYRLAGTVPVNVDQVLSRGESVSLEPNLAGNLPCANRNGKKSTAVFKEFDNSWGEKDMKNLTTIQKVFKILRTLSRIAMILACIVCGITLIGLLCGIVWYQGGKTGAGMEAVMGMTEASGLRSCILKRSRRTERLSHTAAQIKSRVWELKPL